MDPSVGLVLKANHYHIRHCVSQFSFLKTIIVIGYNRKPHSIPGMKIKTIQIAEHVYGQIGLTFL